MQGAVESLITLTKAELGKRRGPIKDLIDAVNLWACPNLLHLCCCCRHPHCYYRLFFSVVVVKTFVTRVT